jgi:hypothetical protein
MCACHAGYTSPPDTALVGLAQLQGGGVPRSTAGLDWEEYWKSTARIPQAVAACGLSA